MSEEKDPVEVSFPPLDMLVVQVHVDCEVYGLFSDLLPATLHEQGGELQWGRARQGVVPDAWFASVLGTADQYTEPFI